MGGLVGVADALQQIGQLFAEMPDHLKNCDNIKSELEKIKSVAALF